MKSTRILILAIICLMAALRLGAQTKITGTVVDVEGEPLTGVAVKVRNNAEKTAITDIDGNFSIEAKKGQILQFSYVGMNNEQLRITDATHYRVTMKDAPISLNEVVAIGYGTMKRSDLTGSVVSVGAKDIERSNATSIDDVFLGRLAGVQMTSNSGIPGGGSSIQIRGMGSINSTNEPIYVIDGVTISGNTGSNTDNALSAINPNDIESIEVLKDASATAIYGSQGANGVIIITTKRGKEGRARITMEVRYGISQLPKELPMANLAQFATHNNVVQQALGYGQSVWFQDPETLGAGTNWQSEVFRDASSQTYNLGISGGKDKNLYRISVGYLTQDGIAIGSDFNRLNANISLDNFATSWLKVGGTGSFTNQKQTITIADWNLIGAGVRQKPSIPVTNLDGSYAGPDEQDNTLSNPIAIAQLYDKYKRKVQFRGNLYAQLIFAKWINFKSVASVNYNSDETHSFVPEYYFNDFSQNADAIREETLQNTLYWSWQNTLNISYKPWKKQSINLMLGQEMNATRSKRVYGKRLGGEATLLGDLSAGDSEQAWNDGYTTERRYLSFFARLNYNFKDRYLLTTTLRADGSSNFDEGHKWGWFPSVALAWRANKENFLKEHEWLNNLKLRLGYGHVGNSNVSAFAYAAMLKNISTIWGSGQLLSRMPNQDLTWETTKSWNVGLDFAAFNNRIELIADFYDKTTDNLLMVLSLPGITGTNGTSNVTTQAPWSNVGSISNRGIELSINTVNISSRDFVWRSSLTFTLNHNKVKSLNTSTATIDKTYQTGGKARIVTRTQAGHAVGEFWGYRCIGRINSAADIYDSEGNLKIALPTGLTVNRENGVWVGDLIFEDLNGDGIIDENDQTFIGSPHPKFIGGLGNTLSWKGLELSLMFTFSYGNKIMNWLSMSINNPNERMYNITERAATRYAQLGLIDPNGSADNIYNVVVTSGDADMYRLWPNDPNDNNRISSRLIEDGSYFRLQTLTLSYSLPKDWIEHIKLQTARIYFNATNLFTLTHYSGYDPMIGLGTEQYSTTGQNNLLNGFDTGRYPNPRTFNFGLNIEF